MSCGGWETTLDSCNKQVYPQFTCSRSNVAGVLCGYGKNKNSMPLVENFVTDCNDGDIRLVGSQYKYEGTVEICFESLWGLISDSNWNINDANVVCRQLGYQTAGTVNKKSLLDLFHQVLLVIWVPIMASQTKLFT